METVQSISCLSLTFLFALLIFFGLQEGISLGQIEPTWINYTFSDDNAISFSYPSIWTFINDTSKHNDVIVTLVPPNNFDLFAEKMIFGMERLRPNTSLHDYSNNAIKILSMTMDNFQLLDSNSFVVSGTEWERILFTHESDKRVIKVLQFWSIKDDYVYIVSFGTTSNSYLSYLPTVDKIISSIKIITKNTTDNIVNGTVNGTIFQSPEGFVLEYPSSWKQVSGQNRVSFISNQDDPQDRYLERVDIYHYRNDDNYLSDNIMVENSSLNFDLISEINYLANNLKNLDLISLNNINFSNVLNGKELIYTFDSNLGPTKSKEVMVKSKTHLFVIIFTAQKDEFDKFSPNINKILHGFRLNPSNVSE
ncbi:hypothetical protein [Candidatus Nitrosocosmicus sp. T]